jgi:hypothetical protein
VIMKMRGRFETSCVHWELLNSFDNKKKTKPLCFSLPRSKIVDSHTIHLHMTV